MTDTREYQARERERPRQEELSVKPEPIRDLDMPEDYGDDIVGGVPPSPCVRDQLTTPPTT